MRVCLYHLCTAQWTLIIVFLLPLSAPLYVIFCILFEAAGNLMITGWLGSKPLGVGFGHDTIAQNFINLTN